MTQGVSEISGSALVASNIIEKHGKSFYLFIQISTEDANY